jgi:hypothetical protein
MIEARRRRTQDATALPDHEELVPASVGHREGPPSYDTAMAHHRGTGRCAPRCGGAE